MLGDLGWHCDKMPCVPGLKCELIGACFDSGFEMGPNMECTNGGAGDNWIICAKEGEKCDPAGSDYTKCAPGLKCEGVRICSNCTMIMQCVKAGNFVYICISKL